ncbi:MAG: Phenylalanine--tRNA ligase beta subunit [Chloroflexi bacterium ADurb.Bin325]|nr:MAG: Phenylalanine--tRNA ligase beta subunit [Chloroflexi bacterium ADurb.Bin325]
MKIPLSWLRDYVDIDLPVEQLADRMTLAGLEVDAITRIGELWDRDKLFVGQILEVRRHPDAERLTLVRVDYGAEQPLTVVTGAPNLYPYASMDLAGREPKVAFAVAGARLIDGHSAERRIARLKPSKIRGVMSEGMVCSEKELDLSDDHEGIIILPDDAPVGVPLVDYLGDIVLDYDVKGAIAHLQSVYGAAREVSALTGRPLRDDVMTVLERRPVTIAADADFAAVVIDAPDLCLRYSAALIEDVQVGPSPLWMQQRLQRAGMRPINNVVDVTNYVMLELGQALHAFDYDLLVQRADGRKPHIIMRRAHEGERIQTLDGVDRQLDPETLLITDTAGAVAIGGIMGGAETEITAGTTAILLEAANFHFLGIRRASQALGLRSEASNRFGKRVDPELTVKALARACQLLEELAGGRARPVYVDNYPGRPEPKHIVLDPAYVNRLLGVTIPAEEQARILRSLEFGVAADSAGLLQVDVPSFRQDVSIPADLAEEVARIYGYDRMAGTLLEDELPRAPRNLKLESEEKVRDVLTGCGLDEVITYSMIDLRDEAKLLGAAAAAQPHVTVLNPLSVERGHLRTTLLPELIRTARANLRFTERVAIFELGRIFIPRPDETLPAEPRRLATLLVGPREPASWLSHDTGPMGFFDLKGVVETLTERLGVPGVTWERGSHPALHPGRTAEVRVNGQTAGAVGELHPQLRDALDLPDLPVALMELDLDVLLAGWGSQQEMVEFSLQPPVFEDLALLVDEGVAASQVAALIRQTGGKLLVDVRLFDMYRGGQIPAGKKSLAYSLTFQAADRTLTAEDTAKARQRIVARLEREIGATLRG